MPLITTLFLAHVAGLWLGIGGHQPYAWAAAALIGAAAWSRRSTPSALAALTLAGGVQAGSHVAARDLACRQQVLRQGTALVHLAEPLRPGQGAWGWTVGDCRLRVRVSAQVSAPSGAIVRVEGPFRRAGQGLAVRRAVVETVRPAGVLSRSRATVGARIDAAFGADAPLVRALVLAEQYDLGSELRSTWADAGIIHMVSVSGLHVSIIAGALIGLFRSLGQSRTRSECCAIAVLAVYIAWIGAPPPAVRSAGMTALVAASRWVQRPTSPWAIWAAGSALSLAEPRVVNDLGWQLSVAGMAGLMASGSATALLRDRPPVVRWVCEGMITTAVATVVSAPIVAWTFGRISVAALFGNLAAAPLFNVAQPLLFGAVALGWLPEYLSGFLVDAARGALWLIHMVAAAGANLPFGVIAVSPDAFTATCLLIVAVGVVTAGAGRYPRRGVTIALVAMLAAAWRPLFPRGSGRLELHVIDVGQGDALALRTPHGRWILVDAGPAWPGGDAGARTVAPYLRRFGGDVVHQVVTHPHLDHYGGVGSLLAISRIDTLWDATPDASRGYEALRGTARAAGTVHRGLMAGDSLALDGVVLRVLAPTAAWRHAQDNPNEASVVLRVEFGRQRWLLMGDAESGAEGWLQARLADDLWADVLKVGHHGSGTSSSPAFLASVRPRVALMSVGRDNDYGHPSEDVLQALNAAGVHVLRTDDDGTIVLSTDGRVLDVRTEAGRWGFSGNR